MGQAEPPGGMVGRMLGPYRLVEALGSGGMGEVYLAEDTRLDRRVALKVLPPEMASHPEKLQRFEREARVVASLSHPSIVTLHSIEEADGLRFITMEHVEGETLGKMIPERGFPLERFLPLAISLADALAAAHRQGILHRDLKPDNVMLTPDGRLKVLDFGLAKLRYDGGEDDDRTTRETQSVTQDGRIVGTVAYMSPEQAQGLPLDHRTDIFSLGILLYEMATGERPFRGQTNLSVLSSILKDTPRPVSELRDDIPRPLGRMIQRALEKRPEDRYQSASDLRRDLEDLKRDVDTGEVRLSTTAGRRALASLGGSRRRWLAPAVASAGLVLAAIAALSFFEARPRRATAADGRRSVAVFYFDNLSGDPQLDWLRTGLTDMLVTNLSQSPGLRVLGTSRLYQILEELGHRDDRGTSASVVASVAEKAQATAAVVGSFVKAGDQIRIQATLQDPKSGEVLASERVEGNAEDGLFALVDDLTGRMRRRLEAGGEKKMADRKIEEVTTRSIEAYKAYARGSRYHERLDEHEALPYFEKAVKADPGFAMALAKLSVVHDNLGEREKARKYAALALERSDKLPDAERHYIEGRYYSLDPATIQKAIGAYEAAVDAAPDHTSARNNLAQLLNELHRYPEALVHLEDLRRRGMTFPGTWMSLAEAYVATSQPQKAESALREYVDEHPDRAAGHENLGYFLLAVGRYDDAAEAFGRARDLDPLSYKSEVGRVTAFTLEERWDEAREAAGRLLASDQPQARLEGGAALATLHLYRGELGEARGLAATALKKLERPDLRAGVRLFRADMEAELGNDREALAEADGALAERTDDVTLRARGNAVRALCLTRMGRAGDAKESISEVEKWLSTLPGPIADPIGLHLRGELALARGDRAQARRELAKAADLLDEDGLKMDDRLARVNYVLGRAALEDGDVDAARRALGRVLEAGPARAFAPLSYVRSVYLLAGIEDKAGRAAKARELYEKYVGYWKGGEIDRAALVRASKRLAALRSRPAA